MNLKDINEIINMLDWNNPYEIQNKGIESARKISNLIPFILPQYSPNSKAVWENCAKILSEKKDKDLVPYLPKILEWLQDLNWPGALIIQNRLKKMQYNLLKNSLYRTIDFAIQKQDSCWLVWLNELVQDKQQKENIKSAILWIENDEQNLK